MAVSEQALDCLLCRSDALEVVPQGAWAVARRPAGLDVRQCTACEGQAHLAATDARGYRVLRPCPGALRDRRIELFNAARLPGRYVKAELTSFELRMPEHPGILEELGRYLAGFIPGQRGRLLTGGVGTGKTHLLVAMLRYLTLDKGIACRYVEFSHLLAELRRIYGEEGSESSILEPLARIPVLAIDELGKGRATEWELRVIDELISRRYNDASLTTFFATNYLPGAMAARSAKGVEVLADRIGERAESRIYEMCEFIPLSGSDYRVALYRGRS